MLIKDESFRIGDTKFMLTSNGTAEIKNVVTDPATGQTYLDTAYATQFQLRLGAFLCLAVGGEQARRRVSCQIERVEIGASAQHRFLGKLLHHLARPVVDHLIDDRSGVAIDNDLIALRMR